MPSAGLRSVAFWLKKFESVGGGLVDEDVICVLSGAYPTSKDQDFSIVYIAGMPPTFQPFTIAHHFLPVEVTSYVLVKKLAEINTMNISLELIIIPASADNIEMVSY